MALADNVDLLVRDGHLADFELVETSPPSEAALRPGEILVRVEKFGFSANNITYAILGRSMRYFDFFPAGEEGRGKVPVWGIGTVAASCHPDLQPGTRMYGYFPLARYATLLPARMTTTGFEVDRGSLAAVYNQYALLALDPFYVPAQEDYMLLFRPLFFTSLLLDDYLADGHDYFGADVTVISSASSKTSFGLAFMLGRRRGPARRTQVIGLTSARHAQFVQDLGVYDRVLPYSAVDALPPAMRVVFVDVAGDAGLLRKLQERFGANLRATVLVGISHWDQMEAGGIGATGERTHFFFAPGWVAQRQNDWGMERLGATLTQGWRAFLDDVERRCRIVYGSGSEAVAATYRTVLAGQQPPDQGSVLSLWEDAFASFGVRL